MRPVAERRPEGNDVAFDAAHAADHGVAADADILVDGAQTAENGEIAHGHMAGDGGVVDEDDVVAHPAVVGHMRADHEQAAVAHSGLHAAAFGAGVHRHVLADDAALADDEARRLAAIFEVLRRVADGSEGEDAGASADLGPPGDHGVREQLHPVFEDGFRSDAAIGADDDAGADPRAVLDHRCGVDRRRRSVAVRRHSSRSLTMAEIVASAASAPSTVALHANFHTLRWFASLSTRISMVSPGTTGWRKRARSMLMK